MSISNRERFLGICRFERPGDLLTSDEFWPETLEEWVKQGAPKQIKVPTLWEERMAGSTPFLKDYFQFDHRHSLAKVIAGIGSVINQRVPISGHGITRWQRTPVVPSYEPRIVAEDEHTITHTNGDGVRLKALKDSTRMPMYLD